MKWADFEAELTKDSVRTEDRLKLLKSIESTLNTGGTDQVRELLLEMISDTIIRAKELQAQLLGNHETSGEEDADANDD